MIKKSTGSIENCIIAAHQFFEVAEMLSDDYIADVRFVRPFFVNAAISCELFLKSIQMIESRDNTFEKGHKLDELFAPLSEKAKDDITDIYDKYYEGFNVKIELNSFLSSYTNSFVEFRYTFEKSAEGNSRALLIFAKSLYVYIKGISKIETAFENEK